MVKKGLTTPTPPAIKVPDKENKMLYTLIAKRFSSDGMVADKRVHTGLTLCECRELHNRYSPKLNDYWSEVRSFAEEKNEKSC